VVSSKRMERAFNRGQVDWEAQCLFTSGFSPIGEKTTHIDI